MPFIYITGPSGAGKSTIRQELSKLGYEAHDTDEDGMSAWYDNQTLELIGPRPPAPKDRPADWYEKHDYRLSAERVKELAIRSKDKLVFLCGIPANDKEFREYYDTVICLAIDEATMKQRIATRTTNNFGKSPDELKLILYWHGKMLERYKEWGATMVDASQPLDAVVKAILKECGADTTYFLRVFTDSLGGYGDRASVVVDNGRRITDVRRLGIARELNTGETIFINDLGTANISVVHPQGEIGFAGVGVVGAAWLLAKLRGRPTDNMQGRDGEIIVWQEDDLTWARSALSSMPPWNYKQLKDASSVEAIKLEDTKTWQHTMAWAWADEASGLIRARTFAADWDIPEAQGNGSGSMILAAKLGRAIEIRHGDGSVIFAKPAADNCADIGGRVVIAG